jgi:hypothetical protein
MPEGKGWMRLVGSLAFVGAVMALGWGVPAAPAAQKMVIVEEFTSVT